MTSLFTVLGVAPSHAFRSPSHYACQDYWIDPDGDATSALFPGTQNGAPLGENRVVYFDVPTARSTASINLTYKYQTGPSPDLILNEVEQKGAEIRLGVTYPLQFPPNIVLPSQTRTQSLDVPTPSPGEYRLSVRVPYGCARGVASERFPTGASNGSLYQWILRVAGSRPTIIVSTLSYLPLNRNFMTASLDEVQYLRATPGVGASFALLEDNFRAWPVIGDAPPNVAPVCRFFRASTVTHAYSADAVECASLRADPAWKDEGLAFRALIPTNGACASGTEPIYKLTNATLGDTQRYTRSEMTYRTLALNGWAQRGVAFCSPVG